MGRNWGRGWARAAGLGLGVLLDAALGDPRRHHPVAWFGTWALWTKEHLWADRRSAGLTYTIVTIVPWAAASVVAERLTARSPLGRVVVTAATTWAVVGATSLAREGAVMESLLQAGDLPRARTRLSHLCSRDASELDTPALARATIESVTENTSDATVAPLWWGAIAGIPGLVVFRAANTLDAMVGYRDERHLRFGWASARLDDALGLVPARITAGLTVAAAATRARGKQAWTVWRRDAKHHLSPNAGPVEASAAGALGIRLGGTHTHAGVTSHRAILGGEFPAPGVMDIGRTVRLSRALTVAATAACGAVAVGMGALTCRKGVLR